MDSRFVKENQIIDRYLMNQLSAVETEEFEKYFIDDPEVVEEIELRKRFIGAIREVDRAEILNPRKKTTTILWRWVFALRPSMSTVVPASAVILLIVAGLLFMQITHLQKINELQSRQISQMLDPQTNTMLVSFARTRGTSAGAKPVTRIRLSSEVKQVVLALNIEHRSFDRYELNLSRKSTGHVWSQESDDVPPAVILPVRLLSPGDYDLSIYGIESGNVLVPAAQFSFTVLDN